MLVVGLYAMNTLHCRKKCSLDEVALGTSVDVRISLVRSTQARDTVNSHLCSELLGKVPFHQWQCPSKVLSCVVQEAAGTHNKLLSSTSDNYHACLDP